MIYMPGLIAQSVVSRIADPGVESLNLARPHTLLVIDHEIISKVILLFLLIQTKVCAPASSLSLPREKVRVFQLTVST